MKEKGKVQTIFVSLAIFFYFATVDFSIQIYLLFLVEFVYDVVSVDKYWNWAFNRILSSQVKRDLTLGARPVGLTSARPGAAPPTAAGAAPPAADNKKKFVPNLNVVRNIKKEADLPSAREERGGKKGRKENKHEKREKHSKDRPALIQTLGSIFADGEIIFPAMVRDPE